MTPFPRKSHQNVAIEADVYEGVKELAEQTGESPTRLINQILREYIQRYGNKRQRDDTDNTYHTTRRR